MKKERRPSEISPQTDGFGYELAPSLEFVVIYFAEKGFSIDHACVFFDYYQSRGWRGRRGTKLTNWKQAAWKWILAGKASLK